MQWSREWEVGLMIEVWSEVSLPSPGDNEAATGSEASHRHSPTQTGVVTGLKAWEAFPVPSHHQLGLCGGGDGGDGGGDPEFPPLRHPLPPSSPCRGTFDRAAGQPGPELRGGQDWAGAALGRQRGESGQSVPATTTTHNQPHHNHWLAWRVPTVRFTAPSWR